MDIKIITIISLSVIISAVITFFIVRRSANKQVSEHLSIIEAISLEKDRLTKTSEYLDKASQTLDKTKNETQELLNKNKKISQYQSITEAISLEENKLSRLSESLDKANKKLDEIKKITEEHLRKNHGLSQYESINEAISLEKDKLTKISESVDKASQILDKTKVETRELQSLKENADKIAKELGKNKHEFDLIKLDQERLTTETKKRKEELHQLLAKLDLYSSPDEFVDYGFFEMPEYLFETSERFTVEIKLLRQQQKDLIQLKNAIVFQESLSISSDKSQNTKILNGQVKMMLTAFNIECDLLLSKVSPSNLARSLERVEKLANTIEKSAASFLCGFNIEFIKLKYEECRLQYQFKLKQKEEQDEQRQIREQIREEQKAIKEYERAVANAEKEEQMYRSMLTKAREELSGLSEQKRLIAEERITILELQLAEAESKEERARSMAQQTRKGHVYIISNVGSFGEGVYKIGLTRRLEPMDRVKELGDASVPFPFDVHAMVYVEDAPALESSLHRIFTESRVNAVNLRKEFFRVSLKDIKDAVERISGSDIEFRMTALAKDYFESQRLHGIKSKEESFVPVEIMQN